MEEVAITEKSEIPKIRNDKAIEDGIRGGIQGEGKAGFIDKSITPFVQRENLPLYPSPETILLAISANFAPSENVR